MKAITKNEIIKFAENNDAVTFEKWCEENKIDVNWLDVCLTNYNNDYYNVDLPKYSLNVCYYGGELDEINEL